MVGHVINGLEYLGHIRRTVKKTMVLRRIAGRTQPTTPEGHPGPPS